MKNDMINIIQEEHTGKIDMTNFNVEYKTDNIFT